MEEEDDCGRIRCANLGGQLEERQMGKREIGQSLDCTQEIMYLVCEDVYQCLPFSLSIAIWESMGQMMQTFLAVEPHC